MIWDTGEHNAIAVLMSIPMQTCVQLFHACTSLSGAVAQTVHGAIQDAAIGTQCCCDGPSHTAAAVLRGSSELTHTAAGKQLWRDERSG